jgi:biotin carboxyl carrier protein
VRYFLKLAGESFEVELAVDEGGATIARTWKDGASGPDRRLALRPIGEGRGRFVLEIDGVAHDVLFESPESGARGHHVTIDGERRAVAIEDERERAAHLAAGEAPQGPVVVRSPMPGIVRAVLVEPGDAVAAHQPLVILEAMKMENELRAEHAGVVRQIHVAPGTAVDGDQELVVLDPPEAPGDAG